MILRGINILMMTAIFYLPLQMDASAKTEHECSLFSVIHDVSLSPIVCGAPLTEKQVIEIVKEQLRSWAILKTDTPTHFGQGMSVLQVMIGPIAQESSKKETPVHYLPVLKMNCQLLVGARLNNNPECKLLT